MIKHLPQKIYLMEKCVLAMRLLAETKSAYTPKHDRWMRDCCHAALKAMPPDTAIATQLRDHVATLWPETKPCK